LRRWTHELKIIPNKADMASFDVQANALGLSLQLFKEGQLATYSTGRWGLIGLRKGAAMELAVVYPPHEVIKTTIIRTRCAAIYKGSLRPDLAQLFLRYLASEAYSDTVIESADALPPNPVFMKKDSYRRPPKYSNEWGCHEVFAQAADEIAAPPCHSPFIAQEVAMRIIYKWLDKFEVGLCSAAEAASSTQVEINAEMERSIKEMPALVDVFKQRQNQQKKIDEHRLADESVPASWIDNPYYLFAGRKNRWIMD
jgi:multiple sugar transport system substrate-binding protein